MKGHLKFQSSFCKSFNFFFVTISILLLSSHIIAQDSKRIEELTRKLEDLNKQIEGCGSDLGCIQSKMAQIQQLSKEVQSLQKDLNKNPEKLAEGFADKLPKETEFPAPFENITKPWVKHTMAVSTVLKLNCETISNTREEIENLLAEIEKKGEGLTGPGWNLQLAHCKETYVKLTEHGILKKPESYQLEYSLQFIDRAVWIAKYWLILGDKHMKVLEKHSYALGLADQNKRNTKVLSYSGWIMDQRTNPPTQLTLDHYEILEEEVPAFMGSLSYQGYTMIFPKIIEDPKDTFKIGKVSEYLLLLPIQIVQFYPAAMPDFSIYTESESMNETFTPEEMQGFFEQGKFKKSYSAEGITQEIEIGFEPLGCEDQISSTKGAIILAGDCIDHGGYVIANDKTTITVNGKIVAKIGDKVLCFKHGETEIIASSNNNVLSGKKQIARIGDKTKCGATLLGGSMDTFAGDK